MRKKSDQPALVRLKLVNDVHVDDGVLRPTPFGPVCKTAITKVQSFLEARSGQPYKRFDPSGAAHRHSETKERTSDTTNGATSSSGAAHRQGAPPTSPIDPPAFVVVPRAETAADQHGTPCVPTHPGPAPDPQRPRNAPATPPTVPQAPPGLRTDREHQPRALSPLPRFSRSSEA